MRKVEKIYYLMNVIIGFLLIISLISILIYSIPDISLIKIYVEEIDNYRSALLSEFKLKISYLFIPSFFLFCITFFLLVYMTDLSKKKEFFLKKFTHIKSQLIKILFFLIFFNSIINISFLIWRLNNSPPAGLAGGCVIEFCAEEYYYFLAMKIIWIRYILINALMLVISIIFLGLIRIESKLNEKINYIPYRIISCK